MYVHANNAGDGCLVTADGSKGKTWGPSTFHQKERKQIIEDPAVPETNKILSMSAPNLEKQTIPRSRQAILSEIGTDEENE